MCIRDSFFDMPEVADFLPMIALALPFTSLFTTVTGLFNGTRQMKVFATLMTSQSVLRVVLVLALVGIGSGVKGAVWGLVLTAVGTAFLGLYLSREHLRPRVSGWVRNTRKLVRFGGQMFTVNAANVLLTRMDIVMVGHYLLAADVGHYSAAVTLVTLFPILPSAVQKITFPAASAYWARRDYRALGKMIDKSMKYSACMVIPIGLGVGFFASDLLELVFGAGFRAASAALCVLLVANTMRAATAVPIGNVLPATGRPYVNLTVELVSAGLNLGLNILLIPRYDILGAAIATAVSLTLALVLFFVFTARLLPVRIDFKWYALGFGSACVAALSFWATSGFSCQHVMAVAILIAYVAFMARFLLNDEDRRTLWSLARSLATRR